MTLDEAKVNQNLCILGINKRCHKTSQIALKEIGIFPNGNICKICENSANCAIFRLNECNRILLYKDFSKLIEVVEPE